MGATSLATRGGPPPPRPCAATRPGAASINTAATATTGAVRLNISSFIVSVLIFLREALIDGLDELVGGPDTAGRAVDAIVIHGQLGRFDLVERQTALDSVLNAV